MRDLFADERVRRACASFAERADEIFAWSSFGASPRADAVRVAKPSAPTPQATRPGEPRTP